MKLFDLIAEFRFDNEREKTFEFWAQKQKMVDSISGAFKVFRKPYFVCYIEDYDGPAEYVTLFGKKLFKKPVFLIKHKWEYKKLSYRYVLGEFHITSYPSATCVMYGRKVTILTLNPKAVNETNRENYWMSIIEYLDGHGSHKGSLSKTIEKLGKESRGVPFGDFESSTSGNSMYFIVDRNYINPECYDEYDRATKRYNDNESPLMI